MKKTNKEIVDKTKEILKDLGYEIKTNHIYEMYSRMAGYKNYHVAKTKNIDFQNQVDVSDKKSDFNVISELKNIKSMIEQNRIKIDFKEDILKKAQLLKTINLKKYEKLIQSEELTNSFVYGIDLESDNYLIKSQIAEPGSLFVGSMGSGKSLAMKFSLFTNIVSNSKDTAYILFDPLKGMSDYKDLFHLKNVYPILDFKITDVINYLHNEMIERKKLFSKESIVNIEDFNIKSKSDFKLSKIVVAIEEWQSFIQSTYLNFNEKHEEFGSIAWKMKELFRVGRGYGIVFMAASQRAAEDELPSILKCGFSTIIGFKSTSLESVSRGNIPECVDIPVGFPGFGVLSHEKGLVQFPFLDKNTISYLLEKYYKKTTSQCLTEIPWKKDAGKETYNL